jgi:hypothetical protein
MKNSSSELSTTDMLQKFSNKKKDYDLKTKSKDNKWEKVFKTDNSNLDNNKWEKVFKTNNSSSEDNKYNSTKDIISIFNKEDNKYNSTKDIISVFDKEKMENGFSENNSKELEGKLLLVHLDENDKPYIIIKKLDKQFIYYLGTQGPRGPCGYAGIDGKDGKDSRDGRDGRDGKDGKNGRDGKDGKNGIDGYIAKRGKRGKRGYKGETGDLEFDFSNIHNEDELVNFLNKISNKISN